MASVHVVENPHSDPITKAWAKLDVTAEWCAECDPEIDRMTLKVMAAEAEVAAAKRSLADAVARKEQLVADLATAHAELTALIDEDPDLAAAVAARRH